MQTSKEDIQLVQSPLILPNGRIVPNRLVKVTIELFRDYSMVTHNQVAMEEGIAVKHGRPGRNHRELYAAWARGGWGIIVTGEPSLSASFRPMARGLTDGQRPGRPETFGYPSRPVRARQLARNDRVLCAAQPRDTIISQHALLSLRRGQSLQNYDPARAIDTGPALTPGLAVLCGGVHGPSPLVARRCALYLPP
jgi:hypothetical protein